ncbi:hypothetical protein BH18VER1_BH18VER1_15720 [soil metagenome]
MNPMDTMNDDDKIEIANRFLGAVRARQWDALASLMEQEPQSFGANVRRIFMRGRSSDLFPIAGENWLRVANLPDPIYAVVVSHAHPLRVVCDHHLPQQLVRLSLHLLRGLDQCRPTLAAVPLRPEERNDPQQ